MDFFGFFITDVIGEFIVWLIDPPNEKGIKRLAIIAKRLLAILAIIAVVAAVIILIIWATSYFGGIPT